MKSAKAMEKFKAKVQTMKSGGYGDGDKDFWKLEADKSGNGRAVIRFLPGRTEDDDMYQEVHTHGFKNQFGKWYIENCPKTIGKDCPACDSNYALTSGFPSWDSVPKDVKEVYSKRKKKTSFIMNILVVEDPVNQDNEGKVFLFKANKTIFKKITDKIDPEFDDEKSCFVFDAEEGANFKLKMRQVDGYANFEKSEFDSPSSIGTQKEIDAVLSQLHDINKFVNPAEFKPYAELEEKLDKILNMESGSQRARMDDESDRPKKDTGKSKPVVDDDEDVTKDIPEKKESRRVIDDDDDDDVAFFKNMAAD